MDRNDDGSAKWDIQKDFLCEDCKKRLEALLPEVYHCADCDFISSNYDLLKWHQKSNH